MPLDYMFKVFHCNDTIHRTNETCPHTYFNEYFSSHSMFLFMQRLKLPVYVSYEKHSFVKSSTVVEIDSR